MKVIGLTGGIGSGKSTVAQFLAELGAITIDADKVGHEAFQPNTELWQQVVDAFGQQVVAPNGSIDRRKLGEMVFGNPESLARLNQIMHHRMYDMVKAKLEEYQRQGVRVVVLEAPLLLEAGWTPLVDEIWVVVASETVVLKRLRRWSGLPESETLARIHSQLSSEERIKHADMVINNNGNLDELRARIAELWQGLQV
jgi:dephospho-CoA kinase